MILLRLISLIPVRCHKWIATLLYFLTFPLTGKDRRLIQSNLMRVYQMPAHSYFSKLFVRQNLQTQLMISLETIRYIFSPKNFTIVGFDDVKKTLDQVQRDLGIIVITGHLGSWELAGHVAGRALGRPFYVLAKPSKSKWLTPILNDIREILGMKVLWTDSKTLIREMFTVCQKGDALGFVMDQRPGKRQSGHPSTFLGVPNTNIVSGPGMIAVKKNLPIFGFYLVREDTLRYRAYLNEVLPINHGITDEGLIAQKLADDLSAMIQMYPEQWSWNYGRWGRNPAKIG